MNSEEVREALQSLIRGRGVRRGCHNLSLEGTDATPLFLETLIQEGYRPARVDEIKIEPGERVPAFYVDNGTAHFGWIFWEVFFPGRKRKIFGSVVKNEKGDWAIILGRGSRDIVYVNAGLKELMDLERPSEF
ncbi:MAG TPA: hypothetical protein VE398_02935 [Acidobacteriota bacterium]|nr:hypothetical protein [Acidobacteriota bacterium]